MHPPRPALRRALAALALATVTASAGTVAPAGATLGAPAALAAEAVEIAVTTGADAALTAGCDDGAAGTTLREALCRAAGEDDAVVTVPGGTSITLVAGPLTYAPTAPATLLLTSGGTWVVDGAGRRVLDLDPGLVGGVDVTVERVEIRRGVPDAADAAEVGGGGAVLAGTGDPGRPDALTLRDCLVSGSASSTGAEDAAAPGGAVQMSGGSLRVEGCTFRGNTAYGAPGGAVAMLGVAAGDTVVVTGSTFDGNAVTGGAGSGVLGGGALYVAGAGLTVERSTFTANTVTSGSAAAARGSAVLATGTAAVSGTRVERNTVSGSGGAGDGGALWLASGSVAASVLVGNTDGVTGTTRAASVVGPVAAVSSWWGCAPGGTDAACGAVGVTSTAPRAALGLEADPARPVTGDATTTTARVALADGSAAPPALLAALTGRAVAWVLEPAAAASSATTDVALGADGTAAARFARGPGATLTVRATVDAVTTEAVLEQPVPPTVTAPADATALEGAQATFTTTATGSPAPTLRWQSAPAGSAAWSDVPGATADRLTVDAARAADGTRYRVVAANAAGTATSAPATLTVTWGPEVTAQPADAGGLPGATVRFTVGVAGSPAPAVRWQTAPAVAGPWADVPGETGTTYDRVVGSGDAGLRVRAVLTGAAGEVASDPATLTRHDAPAFTTGPADRSVAEGQVATFAAVATGTPAPALRWQVLAPGAAGWTDVPGATAPTLDVTADRTAQGARYRAVASSVAGTATSTPATLTVLWGPEVTGPADVTVLAGGTARFEVAAAGEPTPVVTWQTSTDGAGWSDVPGAAGPVYERAAGAADDGLLVRAVATGAGGPVATAPATLTVQTPPTFTTEPADVTADPGTDATFTAAATGSPAPALRWQVRPPGGDWADLAGATGGTLVVPATAAAGGSAYRALASNAAGADVPSAAATLRVLTPPAVSDPADVTVPAGGTARFEVAASGDPAPTLAWETSPDGATWTAVPGATGPVLVLPAAADGTRVRALATATLVAGPATATSAAASVTVVAAPLVVDAPDGVGPDGALRVAAGQPVELAWVVDADAGTAEWQASRDGGRTWGAVPDGARATQVVVGAPAWAGAGLRLAAAPTSGTVRHTLTYTPVAADDGLVLRLVVTNVAGTVATDAVTLRVAAPDGGTSPGTPGTPGTPSTGGTGVAPGGTGATGTGVRAALGVTGAEGLALGGVAALLLAAGGALLLAVRRRRG